MSLRLGNSLEKGVIEEGTEGIGEIKAGLWIIERRGKILMGGKISTLGKIMEGIKGEEATISEPGGFEISTSHSVRK